MKSSTSKLGLTEPIIKFIQSVLSKDIFVLSKDRFCLIDKMLNAKKYKKANNSIQRSIRTYLRQVLSYESASQTVNDGFLGSNIRNGL